MRAFVTVALTTVMCAGTSLAQQLELSRTAASGVDSLLAYERSWDRDCRAQATKITITKKPAHGEISIAIGTGTIPDSVPRTGNTGQCAGKQITGNQVMYTSEPGFRGMDSVSYVVTYPNGRQGPTTITITVN